MWLNLYSLLLHGTLEFRIFNKTLCAPFLLAEIELCQKFCDLCCGGSLGELSENSIFSNRSKEEMLITLREFATMSGLSSSSFEILSSIITKTPSMIFPQEYIWSHIIRTSDRNYWEDHRNYDPPHIVANEIKNPEVVDIHMLRGERTSPDRNSRSMTAEERFDEMVRASRELRFDDLVPIEQVELEDGEDNS
jgi:hypothetical protein